MNEYSCTSLGMFSFLLDKYLKVEWLDRVIGMHLIF